MKRCKLLIIPCLILAFALSWGVDQGRARAEEISQPTDDGAASDSQQSVPRRKRTTNAARQEAAKRLEQQRAEQLMKETTEAPPSQGTSSPADVKEGPTNE